jgi:hypothetical protein
MNWVGFAVLIVLTALLFWLILRAMSQPRKTPKPPRRQHDERWFWGIGIGPFR